jgi:Holliday junction resolvase RusA-like endonuclease
MLDITSAGEPIARFWVPGRGVGKGRPQIHWHAGQTYVDYSQNYKDWLNFAADAIHYQAQFFSRPDQPVAIQCAFVNFGSSDADNLVGASLDAMTDLYLQGDSASFVTGVRGRFASTPKRSGFDREVGVLIEVYPAGTIQFLSPGFSDRFFLPDFLATSPLVRKKKASPDSEDLPRRKVGRKTRQKLLLSELSKPPLNLVLDDPDLIAQFWIPGVAPGKSRPYLRWHGDRLITTYSRNYTTWLNYARDVISYQMRSYLPPPEGVRVEVACINYASSDVDNILASCLDALSLSKLYLRGDSSRYVADCAAEFFKSRKRRAFPREQGTWIKVWKSQLLLLEPGFVAQFDLPKHLQVSPLAVSSSGSNLTA